jgi:hypothetical protein
MYIVTNPLKEPEKTILAFKCCGAKQILENGGVEYLKKEYGDYYTGEEFEDFDITLVLDPSSKPKKAKIPEDASEEDKTKIKEENASIKAKIAELAAKTAEKWCCIK